MGAQSGTNLLLRYGSDEFLRLLKRRRRCQRPLGPSPARPDHSGSLPEVFRSIVVPAGAKFWGKIGAFTGPGYLVAVGYIDPGNWATDLAGGARYGYALLSVIAIANLLAIFLQTLSLRLGIATGRDLAQLCRERFNRPTAICLWVACELAIIACDLAEVVGSAIALQLLFGLPLILGVCATALDVCLILWLQNRGFRYIEALVMALLCVIGGCFAFELVIAQPDVRAIAAALLPSHADRHRSGDALSRHRHHRRDGDAA